MKLLEVKAEKRFSAQQALEHEYLNPTAKKKEKPEESSADSLTMSWKK